MGNKALKPPPNYTFPSLKSEFEAISPLSVNGSQFYTQHYIPSTTQVPAYGFISSKQLSNEWLKSQIHLKPEYLTILTYNVWFQTKNVENRYPCIIKILADSGVDVICLQQVNSEFLNALHSAKEFFGPYKEYYMPVMKMHWYDTLILSKYPCRFYKKEFQSSSMGRCVLTAVFEFEQKDKKAFKLGVNCVHLESLESTKQRINQLQIIKQLNSEMDMSLIAGDFNFSDGWAEDKSLTEYEDVWKSGKRNFSPWATEQMKAIGYTMPKTTQFSAWRPDHIVLKYKNQEKVQKQSKNQIQIVGDFTIQPYSKDPFTLIQQDSIVRTPSDHFGLISKIYL